MDYQRKDHIYPVRPPTKELSKQLQTHDVPTDDEENTNGTNKGGDLVISLGLFPEDQKGCSKWTRGTEELMYIDQYILNESKTRQKT